MQVTNNYYEFTTAGPMTDEEWAMLCEEALREQRKVVSKAGSVEDDDRLVRLEAKVDELVSLVALVLKELETE